MTTAFISTRQRGQEREETVLSARSALAPQCEQNFAPIKIVPKQEGQATVASGVPQWSQRVVSVEAGAPHIGHLSVSVGMVTAGSDLGSAVAASAFRAAPAG
jgi:hypothetical protein